MNAIKLYYLSHSKISSEEMFNILMTGIVYPTELEKYYVLVFTFASEDSDLENVFNRFNGEENPLGTPEKQQFLIENKLHTSATIGDIISLNGDLYCVTFTGFYKLPFTI